MAISAIRASTRATASSNSAASSFGTRPVAGDGICVVAWGTGSNVVTGLTCADNQGVGNVWTLLATGSNTPSATHQMVAIFCCASIGATSGTFTVTVTLDSGISFMECAAEEFSQLALPVDVTQSANNGNAASINPTSGTTASTAQADAVAIAVFTDSGGNETITAPTGYTVIATDPNGGTAQNGQGDYKILSATGTQVATWTLNFQQIECACIAVVKGVASSFLAPLPFVKAQAVQRAASY